MPSLDLAALLTGLRERFGDVDPSRLFPQGNAAPQLVPPPQSGGGQQLAGVLAQSGQGAVPPVAASDITGDLSGIIMQRALTGKREDGLKDMIGNLSKPGFIEVDGGGGGAQTIPGAIAPEQAQLAMRLAGADPALARSFLANILGGL